MAGLTKFHQQLINFVEPQGVSITRTTSGLLFRFPNGETEMIHFTQSDWRATRNARANFKRNGIQWPGDWGDKKRVNPTAKTLTRVREYVDSIADPLDGGVTVTSVVDATGVSFPSVVPALQKLGWWKATPSRLSHWLPPIENPKEVIEEVLADDEPEPTTVPSRSHEREFIDTVDSWTANLEDLDATITVGSLLSAYRAAGLRLELRVWRAELPVPIPGAEPLVGMVRH